MPTNEVLQAAGIFPSILYIGGWACVGVLILVVFYYLIVCFAKSMR